MKKLIVSLAVTLLLIVGLICERFQVKRDVDYFRNRSIENETLIKLISESDKTKSYFLNKFETKEVGDSVVISDTEIYEKNILDQSYIVGSSDFYGYALNFEGANLVGFALYKP